MAGSGAGTITLASAAGGVAFPAGGGAGGYGWASAVSAAPGYGWAATASGLVEPIGDAAGTIEWGSAAAGLIPPSGAGTYSWASVAVGLCSPIGIAAGFRKLVTHASGVETELPPLPPEPENVGLMLIEISSALNDLGDSFAVPDPRITPAVALLSKINSEWARNPTQAATDAASLAFQLQALLVSYPSANRLADAVDCAQQLAGTWSGDDYV